MKFIIPTIAFILLSTIATAQVDTQTETQSPRERGMFGILMGSELTDLNMSYEGEHNMYAIKDLPNPDPALFTYRVRHHETTGVCMVVGYSLVLEATGEGIMLKSRFNRMRDRFDQIYGSSSLRDYILNGSGQLWEEHFASKLYREEAVLAARWFYDNGNRMGEDISMLTLSVKSVNSVSAVLVLEARFNNYAECIKLIYDQPNNSNP